MNPPLPTPAGPFLVLRLAGDAPRTVALTPMERVRIGRTADNDVVIEDDLEVSRAHAVLERVGGGWALVDDGMSRNGSFVNGEKVLRNRRLVDGDVLRVGSTELLFRAPAAGAFAQTLMAGPEETGGSAPVRLTEGERRVLSALCAPLLAGGIVATPASNREVADQLQLSLSGVKAHIRSLFEKLGVDDLPQNRKRAELARRAIDLGLAVQREGAG